MPQVERSGPRVLLEPGTVARVAVVAERVQLKKMAIILPGVATAERAVRVEKGEEMSRYLPKRSPIMGSSTPTGLRVPPVQMVQQGDMRHGWTLYTTPPQITTSPVAAVAAVRGETAGRAGP